MTHSPSVVADATDPRSMTSGRSRRHVLGGNIKSVATNSFAHVYRNRRIKSIFCNVVLPPIHCSILQRNGPACCGTGGNIV